MSGFFKIDHDPSAYCMLNQAMSQLGYSINFIEMPVIRALKEANAGRYALIFIGEPDFETNRLPKSPKDISFSTIPYTTTPVNFYALKDMAINMQENNWLNNYKVGIVRNFRSKSFEATKRKNLNNYSYYTNTLRAFKGLLQKRTDLVIASEIGYLSVQPNLNPNNEIFKVASLGNISIYLGFSNKYFGDEKAKMLTKKFDKVLLRIKEDKNNHCYKTSVKG